MKILFVADGRSPTTISWLQFWLNSAHEVHLVSTFPCDRITGLASLHIIPVAFNWLSRGKGGQSTPLSRTGISKDLLRNIRYWIGPISLQFYKGKLEKIVKDVSPDIIHALRIPFEGMLVASMRTTIPYIISTWGNDLTLHAPGSILMAKLTRKTLQGASGLISDTHRDLLLGKKWGFSGKTMVIPGGGGIFIKGMDQKQRDAILPEDLPEVPLVVNPRGQRPGSLRQDVFFQSISLVLKEEPQTLFICPSLAGDQDAENWVTKYGIQENVRLWPKLTQPQLWKLYRRAKVYVSPSLHDGTPNSMLEAMASGCFPVVGDIESLREWVVQGKNGFLIDPNDPLSIAEGITQALKNNDLQRKAASRNITLIAERAEYWHSMAEVEGLYNLILLR